MAGLSHIICIRTCDYCGKEVEIRHKKRLCAKNTFCSVSCMANFRKEKTGTNSICVICGNKFHLQKKLKDSIVLGETCSTKCSYINKKQKYKGINNPNYGNKGELNPMQKSDIRITNYGYIEIRNNTHPNKRAGDYILFHRALMEEYMRVKNTNFEFLTEISGVLRLKKGVEVHHINEIKTDNRIENLICLTKSEHMSLHSKKQKQIRNERGKFMTTGKKLKNDGKLKRSRQLDAGQDVYSSESILIKSRSSEMIKTNLFVAIPYGHVGLLWSRSGLSIKHKLEVGAGCIDEQYRGEIIVHLYNHGDEDYMVNVGDKIAQLLTMPINLNDYEEVEELDNTERGDNGFGSSGK